MAAPVSAQISATVPAGRLAVPADIAQACLFLGAAETAYITGSTLTVHGGGEQPAWSHVLRRHGMAEQA